VGERRKVAFSGQHSAVSPQSIGVATVSSMVPFYAVRWKRAGPIIEYQSGTLARGHAMKTLLCSIMLLVGFVSPALASHPAQLQVLHSVSQEVRGVGIGPGAQGLPSSPVSCSPPYPTNTVSVTSAATANSGSADQCILELPSGDLRGAVQNRRVEGILTSEDGKKFYVVLECQKQYGWCAPLREHLTYPGTLNDKPKWLLDYQHRPVTSFIKMALRPDGRKKVTYAIEYAKPISPKSGR